MDILDIAPSYPLVERMTWRVLVFEAESGIEQRVSKWAFAKREWDVRYQGTAPFEVTSVRAFLTKQLGGATSFMFKEPYETGRNRVKLGYGDGTRTSWVVPIMCTSVTSVTFHVNSTIVVPTWDPYGGVNSTGLATFSAPASGAPVDFDYTGSYFCPIVRLKDQFQFTLQAPLSYGEMSFTIVETLEQTPES